MTVYALYFRMDYEEDKELVGIFTTKEKLNEYKESLIKSRKYYLQFYKNGNWTTEISELNPIKEGCL